MLTVLIRSVLITLQVYAPELGDQFGLNKGISPHSMRNKTLRSPSSCTPSFDICNIGEQDARVIKVSDTKNSRKRLYFTRYSCIQFVCRWSGSSGIINYKSCSLLKDLLSKETCGGLVGVREYIILKVRACFQVFLAIELKCLVSCNSNALLRRMQSKFVGLPALKMCSCLVHFGILWHL